MTRRVTRKQVPQGPPRGVLMQYAARSPRKHNAVSVDGFGTAVDNLLHNPGWWKNCEKFVEKNLTRFRKLSY